MKYTYSDKRKS